MAGEFTLMARRPTHSGEVLREEFMPDLGLSVADLARSIGVSRQSVNEIVRERRALSPDIALRLASVRHVAAVLDEPSAQRRYLGFLRGEPRSTQSDRAIADSRSGMSANTRGRGFRDLPVAIRCGSGDGGRTRARSRGGAVPLGDRR